MKKLFCLSLLLLIFSCSGATSEDPLILPPNFAEVPDPNKPEKPTSAAKQENVEKLKELLLDSE